jgi:hypothetical protein
MTKEVFLTYEINTNGGNVTFSVSVVSKSKQQTGFSDTGISNEKKFEKVIAGKILTSC